MFVSNSTASSEPAQVESPPPAAPRVQGSATRKVRSRVHGGVKEPRARLLFAPPPPGSPLPSYRRMCPGCHGGLTAPQPAKAHNLFVLCVRDLPPAGKQRHHHVSRCRRWALCSPPRLPHNSFVSSLHDVKLGCLFIPSPEVWEFRTNTQLLNNSPRF